MIPRFCNGLQYTSSSIIHFIQHMSALFSHQQRSNARRESKHFIERQHHEIGGEFGQIEVVCGHIRSCVQQNIPISLAMKSVFALDLRNPMQREDFS